MSLEDRFRQSLAAAIDDVRARLDAEFQAALADARAEADASKAAALAETRLAVEADLLRAFSAEKDTLTFSHQGALAQARESAMADAARLREEWAADIARAGDDSAAELARVRQEAAAEVASAREQAEGALAALREEADAAARQSHDEAEKALADALRQRDELYAAASRVKDEHERALHTLQADLQTAAAAHARSVDEHAASASRLLESVRGLDGAASLTEVLDLLTLAVARESGRAATMVVKGDRLIGWRASGLGTADAEPRTLEANINDVGALAAAVNTTRPAVAGQGSVLAPPAFAHLQPDQVGLAVPLIVGGRAVAVVYSDAGDTTPMPAWQATVEVLVRHAGRCLEAMTVQRAAQARASSARVPTSA